MGWFDEISEVFQAPYKAYKGLTGEGGTTFTGQESIINNFGRLVDEQPQLITAQVASYYLEAYGYNVEGKTEQQLINASKNLYYANSLAESGLGEYGLDLTMLSESSLKKAYDLLSGGKQPYEIAATITSPWAFDEQGNIIGDKYEWLNGQPVEKSLVTTDTTPPEWIEYEDGTKILYDTSQDKIWDIVYPEDKASLTIPTDVISDLQARGYTTDGMTYEDAMSLYFFHQGEDQSELLNVSGSIADYLNSSGVDTTDMTWDTALSLYTVLRGDEGTDWEQGYLEDKRTDDLAQQAWENARDDRLDAINAAWQEWEKGITERRLTSDEEQQVWQREFDDRQYASDEAWRTWQQTLTEQQWAAEQAQQLWEQNWAEILRGDTLARYEWEQAMAEEQWAAQQAETTWQQAWAEQQRVDELEQQAWERQYAEQQMTNTQAQNEWEQNWAMAQTPTGAQPSGFAGWGQEYEWSPSAYMQGGEGWYTNPMSMEEMTNPNVYGSGAWAEAAANWWDVSRINQTLEQAGTPEMMQYTSTVPPIVAQYFQGIEPYMTARSLESGMTGEPYQLSSMPSWATVQSWTTPQQQQMQAAFENLHTPYTWEDFLKSSYEQAPPSGGGSQLYYR